jgi:histidinol-phosphatase (PHP family)
MMASLHKGETICRRFRGARSDRQTDIDHQAWLEMGGNFTLSDDSHGIAQVATNYIRTLDYLEGLGVESVWTLERKPHPEEDGADEPRTSLTERSVSLSTIRAALRLE